MSKVNKLNFLEAKIGHEVFHGWNNDALSIASDAENWFREGVANYYGQRNAGITEYQLWMDGQLDYYCDEIIGTDHDLSLEELGVLMEEGSSTKYKRALYYKGALISYLIDLRLDEIGLNFDDLLRNLYKKFEHGQKQFSNEDIENALNDISGENWSGFFDDYIYGKTPLILDGNFKYINHNS
jgi:predicted metalloprotease with PDZ domain